MIEFNASNMEFQPVLKCGDRLIPFHAVQGIDISEIEHGRVIIHASDGSYEATGFDAVEIVMLLKPSALEGRRLKWPKGAWAFHNIVAHPVMQILAWFGYAKAGIRLHDATTPTPR